MRSPWDRAIGAMLVLAVALAACAHAAADLHPGGGALASATGGACHHATPSCAGAAPSYAQDVRPILQARCFKCHAGEGEAAGEHDFSRIETLRAQKRALSNEIGACAMPPTPEPPVPDEEAEVLLRWAACGGRE
jgi:uncharacterized membrane protein